MAASDASDSESVNTLVRCSNCKKSKLPTVFPFQKGSDTVRIKTCNPCKMSKAQKDKNRSALRAQEEGKSQKEVLDMDMAAEGSDDNPASARNEESDTGLHTLPLDVFTQILKNRNDAMLIEAHVDTAELMGTKSDSRKEIADALSKRVTDAININFV